MGPVQQNYIGCAFSEGDSLEMKTFAKFWILGCVICDLPIAGAFCPIAKLPISDHAELLQKINVYDGIEPKDADQFSADLNSTAPEVNRRFDATNIFACQNAWGNGSLVKHRDTVVTTLHTLYVDGDCNKPRPLSSCGFLYQGQGNNQVYASAKIVASGGCPKGMKLKDSNDWVVIKLTKKLPASVKPYGVPELTGTIKPGDSVIIAGKTAGFNPNSDSGGLSKLPKAYAKCSALGTSNWDFVGLMQSNCPSDQGCSGCSIVSLDTAPKLLSINTGAIPSERFCSAEDGTAHSGNFKLNCRGSVSVPVAGDLLQALKRLPGKDD